MVTYSTNWMGPVSMKWYRERGLTRHVDKQVESQRIAHMRGTYIGERYTIEEPIAYYSAGRIDIRDDSKHGYDGWGEYSIAPMHGEDWNHFSDWLDDLTSTQVLPYNEIIAQFESYYGKAIRWAQEDVNIE